MSNVPWLRPIHPESMPGAETLPTSQLRGAHPLGAIWINSGFPTIREMGILALI